MTPTQLAKTMPTTLQIGHLPFKVVFSESWITVEDSKKWGICDHGTATITLSHPSIMPSKEMLVSVFTHEVLHALWAAAALPDKTKEEAAVAGLEGALTQFIKNNPEAVKWIMKGLK
jgi:hypothetical protein